MRGEKCQGESDGGSEVNYAYGWEASEALRLCSIVLH